ncbi:MAG TPA: exopolysaccharide biosynthesis polyprenyl glycosylphosphotransferase [Gammaproteobacteria bacterium]|jgi:exopolysaccharide biosynthesis polyprenyl glycosylphosphotransferase
MAERIVILGTGQLARRIVEEMLAQPDGGAGLRGAISEAPGVRPQFAAAWLGSLPELSSILAEQRPDRIIVAVEEQYGHLSADLLVDLQAIHGIEVEAGLDAYERLTGKLAIESLTAGSVLFSSRFRPSRPGLWFARAYSLAAASLATLLLLPLMAAIALCIRLDSQGPVLFVQERVGLGNRRFRLLKFRSMRVTTQKHSEWAADNEDRITRVGRWLRKFRLDELPQFINVLRGDMNLVGPRPHPDSNRRLFILVSRNTPECGEQIPYYSLRSSIRPGITGWAQVRYKYANGLDEEIEKLRYDLYYIKHFSIWLDMRIMFETVKVVLLGHRRLAREVEMAPAMDGGVDSTAQGSPLMSGLGELPARPLPPPSLAQGDRLRGVQ